MNIGAKTYVILGIIATATAQIFLKIASAHSVMQVKWIICLLVSMLAYLVSFSTYYMALKSYDISKVQPIMMASILSIIALYGFAAGEDISRMRMAGILLSIISIVLISKS